MSPVRFWVAPPPKTLPSNRSRKRLVTTGWLAKNAWILIRQYGVSNLNSMTALPDARLASKDRKTMWEDGM